MSIGRPRRRRNRGFTLIEILIALVVLVIGIVGVFALFPVGIRSTAESVDETNAAMIAESLQNAIIAGMRKAPPMPPGSFVSAQIHHDGMPGPFSSFAFDLIPAGQAGTRIDIHPRLGLGSNVEQNLFQMGGGAMQDVQIYQSLYDVWRVCDASDNLNQYQVGFDLRRPTTANLFEFRIHVFRNYQDASGWPRSRQGGNWATLKHPNWIKTFIFLVAGN